MPTDLDALRLRLAQDYLADESLIIERILPLARLSPEEQRQTETRARRLVTSIRAGRRRTGSLDALLQEYDLSSEEGVVLMCLAEALLRIPDAQTADDLIREKLGAGQWEKHLGHSSNFFVNASTWGLMLTGRVVRLDDARDNPAGFLKGLIARAGEPIIRQAVTQAVRIIGRQFVLGRTIEEALATAEPAERSGYRHSYDMLGEAARTAADAERYHRAYLAAVAAVSASAGKTKSADIVSAPSVSVKLSALHPRYEFLKLSRLESELLPRILSLAAAARSGGIGLTIDAEEADRLDLSLILIERIAQSAELAGWDGLGVAVQAYQKRALGVLAWLEALARQSGRRLPVRLVKGAYWDTEIKRAQVQGLASYPVFTRKIATDTNYLAAARFLLANLGAFYPQFATHNAHTVSAILAIAPAGADFEFQRLHGMGAALYDQIVGTEGRPVRTYAPVGSHEDLLAYLVRRLLENGANTSFVNRLADDEAPIAEIIADPIESLAGLPEKPHPKIPLPAAIFGSERRNSAGILLSDPYTADPLLEAVRAAGEERRTAAPLIGGESITGTPRDLRDPSDRRRIIGSVIEAEAVDRAAALAAGAARDFDRLGGAARAEILERASDLLEADRPALVALLVREAGKTLASALGEIRETVDFLRYYAAAARADFAHPRRLTGPTGERNELSLHGRGVIAAISPWNFPLAIFMGQVAAALAAGNAVVAKPAPQTPLIAARAVSHLHAAGIPPDVLCLLPGGAAVGEAMIRNEKISGVAFTGSTATAGRIRRLLADRDGPIVPFIAETGGVNAMIVDSTALLEQAVADALASAFDSAGQRCSAARLLAVQSDIAEPMLRMLAGAMDELTIGDPMDLATDIGPVIDEAAAARLQAHAARMRGSERIIKALDLPVSCAHGTFFAPMAVAVKSASQVRDEIFGPFLHVVTFRRDELGALADEIAGLGYGLTLGIHTRIDETQERIRRRLPVGNTYVNRNQIGAVVGVQPFGGHGLSGTGPKAGGPHSLFAFARELAVSIDTTSSGGNAALMTLDKA